MGIQMKLAKENNILFTDFDTAYWSIDNISFHNNGGVNFTLFEFKCYPSRVSKQMDAHTLQKSLTFGGIPYIAYNTVLYRWEGAERTDALFPTGIPLLESDQKDVLYSYVKSYLGLKDYIDVLEEEQKAEAEVEPSEPSELTEGGEEIEQTEPTETEPLEV